MYANYLIDVGKLVFIVGDTQSTTQFRNLFQSAGNPKQKIFYKCIEQLPPDTYKKDKHPDQKKGIIRKDWFTKILNKNPQMIVMTFNCTPELSENQVWEDRLKIMIKKINRVYDAMRSNNKEDVRLKIIILISKHTFGGVNLHQKITNFLKSYEKELNIIQVEYYAKEIAKIRSQWIYGLDKNYQNKYKKIQKRWEESFAERKLGCMVKMAILSEMLSKKEEKNKYLETYTYLKKRFDECIRTVSILNHSQLREVRAVADVVFLRFLKSLISINTPAQLLFKQTQEHMNYFKLKNLGMGETNKYYYYEELMWRCTFIENFLEILYKNDLMENVSTLSLCQLLNELITYLHALSVINSNVLNDEKMLGAKMKEERQENFVGLVSYRGEQVLQTDIVYTFISDIISHKKDYLSKGIQLITRYKTMNIFKMNELLFLNIYLLRLYFQDNKFQSFLTTYDEIMKQEISRSNYFLLNQIFNEIQDEFKSIGEEHKVMFHGMSCIICDYFENYSQLQSRLQHLLVSLKKHQDEQNLQNNNNQQQPPNNNSMLESFSSVYDQFQPQKSSQLNEQYKFSLKKKSNIASAGCFIKNQFVYIEDEYKIKFDFKLNPVIVRSGCKINVVFNNKSVNCQFIVNAGSQPVVQRTLTINPLEHFSKDQTLRIETILISIKSAHNLTFMIPNNHISFMKFKQNKIYTKIKCPQIEIKNPYQIYYINEISQFMINIETLNDFVMEAKCAIKEEDPYGKTQVFTDMKDKINLTNSNYYQEIVTKDKTISQFWLKCNKIGQKTLKFNFHFTIEKLILKQQSHDLLDPTSKFQEEKRFLLKQSFTVTKQLKFTIQQLFNIKKTFFQFSNDDARTLQNKNIPVQKPITCSIQISSAQDVFIKEISQHKNPKKVTYLKDIQKRNFPIQKGHKLKLNLVFLLPSLCKDQIQLFLMSTYITWCRISSAFPQGQNQYDNLFLDNQTKINCYTNPLSIFMTTKENFLFKKNQCNKISFKIKNHSGFKSHILVVVQGNQVILRVGEKSKELFVDAGRENTVDFDILPIASGFLPLPTVRVFVDGVERNMNLKQGQVIKCL